MIGWGIVSASTLGVLLLNAGPLVGSALVSGLGCVFFAPLALMAFRGLAT